MVIVNGRERQEKMLLIAVSFLALGLGLLYVLFTAFSD